MLRRTTLRYWYERADRASAAGVGKGPPTLAAP